jgi:hypothetical protein
MVTGSVEIFFPCSYCWKPTSKMGHKKLSEEGFDCTDVFQEHNPTVSKHETYAVQYIDDILNNPRDARN